MKRGMMGLGVAVLLAALAGCGSSSSSSSTPTLASIAVTPAAPAPIAARSTQQFTATGTYSDKSTQDLTSQASWTSSNMATVTIMSTGSATPGLATSVAAGGPVTITATSGTVSGTAQLTVTALLPNLWTWMSGSNTYRAAASYGTLGTPAASNVPGPRNQAASWTDASGNLWLFGGSGVDSNGVSGELNDLWKFDGANWTWVSGSNTANTAGTYGATTGTTGMPGGRFGAVSWIDASGNLWLFGGNGYDINGSTGVQNDLWEFNAPAGASATWTWVSGTNTVKTVGTYGILGTAAASNVPGARQYAVTWISGGNLWLFGGNGYSSTTTGNLNDLWEFNVASGLWTWVSGSNTVSGAIATYGATTGTTGTPGGRESAVSWIDSSGNLWLFGGYGNCGSGCTGQLNDLWEFNAPAGASATWTWMSGNNTLDTAGIYSGTVMPGARYEAVSWIDASGNLWLFGGFGWDTNGTNGALNDLWEFTAPASLSATWIWVSGSSTVGAAGSYGTLGAADPGNVPGSRNQAVSWTRSGQLWLFGGFGYDSAGNQGNLNDLWSYVP